MKARQAALGALAAAVTLTVVVLALRVPASADAPTESPFEFVFDDVNPCTGNIHTVTIAGTTSVHDHDAAISMSGSSILVAVNAVALKRLPLQRA